MSDGLNNQQTTSRQLITSIIFAVLNIAALVMFVWILKMGFEPLTGHAATGIYKALNFRGTLKNSDGTAVTDGAYNFYFSIYDASSAGTCLYTARGTCGTPTAKSITVTSGVFSTLIGDTDNSDNAITIDFNSDTYWLGVTVGTDSELTPRVRIGAAGYAFNADLLDGLNTSSNGGTTSFVPVTNSYGSLMLTGVPQTSSVSSSTFYVNPASATAGYGLLGAAVGGVEKFRVDASGNVAASGTIFATGAGTSTFSGGLTSAVLNVTSASVTSTFANGIQLNGGCFSDISGNCISAGGANAWTDGGSEIYLTTSGDNVTIGATGNLGKLTVLGDADEKQFVIKANGTQNANIFEIQNSSSAPIAWVSPTGNFGVSGTIYGSIATSTWYASVATTTFDGVTIGGSTAATGTFTGLIANQTTSLNGIVNIGDNGDAVVVHSNTWDVSAGGVISDAQYSTSTWDGVSIGATTPGTGAFTNLSATGLITGSLATSTWYGSIATSTFYGSLATSTWYGSIATSTFPNITVTNLATINKSSSTLASAYQGLFVGTTATTSIYGDTTSTFQYGLNVATNGGTLAINNTPVCLQNGANCAATSTGAGWTDGGTEIYLTTSGDNVTVGASGNLGKLTVLGDADEKQFVIKANGTQNANIFEIQNSSSAPIAWVSPNGNFGVSGTIYGSIATSTWYGSIATSTFYGSLATSTWYGSIATTSLNGVTIGQSTRGAGYFTNLDFNGTGTLGDGDDDIAINSNDWDITSAGVTSNLSITTSTLDNIVIGGSTAANGKFTNVTSTLWASFNNASSTLLSVFNSLYVGGTATSTFVGGSRGAATSTLYSDLSIVSRDLIMGGAANTGWFWVGDGTATTSIRGGTAGATTSTFAGDVVISNLYSGLIEFDEDGGVVDAMNIPVASAATGTVEGYTFNTDGLPTLFVGGTSDGLASVWDRRVGVNTISPSSTLEVIGTLAIGNNSATATIYANTTSTFQYGLNVATNGGTLAINNTPVCLQNGANCAATSTGAGWTDGGTEIYLTTSGDNVTVGATGNLGKLTVLGDADEKQFVIKANGTQNANIFEIQNSSNVPIAWVSPTGNFGVSGTIYGSLATSTWYASVATTTLDGVTIGGSTPAAGSFTLITGSLATSTWYGNIATSTFPNITVTNLATINRSSSTLDSVYQGLFVGTTATTSIYGNTTSTFANGLTTLGQLSATGSGTSTISYGLTLATSGGNVGIGTTSPAYLFDVNGTMRSSGLFYPDRGISTSTLDNITLGVVTPTRVSSTLLSVMNTLYIGGTSTSTLTTGNRGLATSTFYSDLSVVSRDVIIGGGQTNAAGWLWVGDGTATTSIRGGTAGSTTSTFEGDVSIANLYVGSSEFVVDSGIVGAFTMPVSASAATGTEEGYTFAVDNLDVARIVGTADALGSVWDLRLELTDNKGTATTTIRGVSTATSTFAGGLEAIGNLSVIGSGTSTLNKVQATLLNITSNTTTSTFANGIQLNGGCVLVGGACVGTGGGGWTDGGAEIYLTTSGDDVTVGASGGTLGKFTVVGDADEKQFVIKANGTQNANIFEIQNSSSVVLSYFDLDGILYTANGLITAGPATLGNNSADNITFNGSIASNAIPSTLNNYDLGSSAKAWQDVYASGTIFAAKYYIDVNATERLCSSYNPDVPNPEVGLYDCTGTPGDIAEMYGSFDRTIEAGDVVKISSYINDRPYVEKTAGTYSHTLGVVSTEPYDKFGEVYEKNEYKMPVALIGRVPVKVSNENGAIQIGDYLTSASLPGYAMKMTRPGVAIGQALSSFDGPNETGMVMIFMGVGYYDGSNFASFNGSQELTATNDTSNIGPILAKNGIDVASSSIINVASISGVNWAIDESGNFSTTGEIIKKVATSAGEKNLYPAYTGDPTMMLTGSGSLINGEARIIFDPTLTEILDPADPIKVTVSMTSEGAQNIYVAEKSIGDILVRETNGGKGGATFDYIIIARRKTNAAYSLPLAYQTTSTPADGSQPPVDPNFPNSLVPSAATSTPDDSDLASSTSTPLRPEGYAGQASSVAIETASSTPETTPIVQMPTSTEPVVQTPTSTPLRPVGYAGQAELVVTETATSTPLRSLSSAGQASVAVEIVEPTT